VEASTQLRFIDADGHVLEHPSGMVAYAPEEYRDRIWHVETDDAGEEWVVWDGERNWANKASVSGIAGMSDTDVRRAMSGELRYTEVRPAGWNAKARLEDMDSDHIAMSVLYPTQLLNIHGKEDTGYVIAQCRAYNDWLSDHVSEGEGRLFGAALLPQQDIDAAATEMRRVARLPGIVAGFIRPNPTEDWKPFNHPVYDPIWRAASETGLALGLHPLLSAHLPGACRGMHLDKVHVKGSEHPFLRGQEDSKSGNATDNLFFSQALSNPFDMMAAMTFLTAGGVCERFPDLRIVFLEANGGWVVPMLERLDHHASVPLFQADVPDLKMAPSDYFRRQCWISFDPDESLLAFTATSRLVGADRIVWASDYPHPDAKFPGTTKELSEGIQSLSDEQQRLIAGQSAEALYNL
jgi:uncharacterized protein